MDDNICYNKDKFKIKRMIILLKGILHHRANMEDCHKLCCTKIKNFRVYSKDNIILDDVNIHIHCGQITAIIGPNGGGKSTLLKAILNQFPHEGKIEYWDFNDEKIKTPIINYVPQQLFIDKNAPTSVLDFFAANLTNFPIWLFNKKSIRQKVNYYLRKTEASHLINKKLGDLSGGEIQRVLLALSLCPIPNLLLLDEPVSGVDHKGLRLFYEMLNHLRKTEDIAIVLISHDLPLVAEYADQVILLNKTVLTQGTPEEVFNDKHTKELFGHIPVKNNPRENEHCNCQKGGCI